MPKEMFTDRQRKALAIKFVLGFPIVGLVWTLIIYQFSDSEVINFKIACVIGGFGLGMGLLCILSETFSSKTWFFWQILIKIIDTTIIWLTLPVFFYLIFSPFAFLLRTFGKSSMTKKIINIQSYWQNVVEPKSKKQYLRQF